MYKSNWNFNYYNNSRRINTTELNLNFRHIPDTPWRYKIDNCFINEPK